MNLNPSQNITVTLGYYLVALIIIGIFAYYKEGYRENITYILKNILILFKNFLHWSISKVIIWIYSFLVGTILSMIFIIISFFLIRSLGSKLDPNSILALAQTGTINATLLASLIENIWIIAILVFNIVLIISFYILAFVYGDILIQNIYKHYLDGEKLPYKQNWYLSFKHMWKYLGVITWISVYLLKPLGVLLSGFIVLFILSYFGILSSTPGTSGSIILGLISIMIFGGSFIYFLYLGIRLMFSYIALVFSDNINVSTKLYITESFLVTKGNVWRILGMGLPFIILNLMIGEIFSSFDTGNQISNAFISIINFLIFGGISYMVYISMYRIVKGTTNIKKISKKSLI